MSTVNVTNIKNSGSASTNIVLDTSGNAAISGTVSMGSSFLRNRIINGDMRIDQRNAGASVTPTTTSFYVLDRWNHNLTVASKFSVQRNAGSVTPPAGFVNYMGITSLSAYSVLAADLFGIVQGIEGYNIADLDFGKATARTITLSFWVRSSITGTHAGAVLNGTSTRSYTFTYTISAANTWEYKTVTIPGDTTGTWAVDQTLGLTITFNLGAGSTYATAAGVWTAGAFTTVSGAVSIVGTNAATFYVTGVQLEAGSVATPFERRQFGTELDLCQRYCVKCDASFAMGQAFSATSAAFYMQLPVPMRATPALSTTASYNCYNVAGGNVSVTPAINIFQPPNVLRIDGTTASGLVAGSATVLLFPTNVNLSAEL
jgi:hypothetical protein